MKYVSTVMAAVLFAGMQSIAPAPAEAEQILRVGIHGSEAGSFDPSMSAETIDNILTAWMYGGLVRFPPGTIDPSKIEPDLAESWTHSDDGLVWTFKLRPNVAFHHGYGKLTAEDVVYSLKRASNPKTSIFASDFAAFDKVEAPDPATVQITLKHRVPSLLAIVTAQRGALIISKKADEETKGEYSKKPIGTGPFQFEEYKAKQFVRLSANADYYRGKPKIDQIFYRYIPSNESRDLAFRAGELDLFYGRKEQKWAERMKSTPGIIIDVFGPGELRLINLNESMKPLDDIRVRQAIAHAINHEQFVKFVGADVVADNPSVVPIGYLGYTKDVPRFKFDVAKAKQLLKEAGYPNGLTLKVLGSNRSFVEPYQLLQAQLAKAGINMDLQLIEHPAWHSQIRKDLSPIVVYTAARFPIADIFLTQFFHSDSAIGQPRAVTNFSHCKAGDKDIDAARVETDPEKQLKYWHEAQRKIIADVCAIPLFDEQQVWGQSNKLDLGYKLEASISFGPMITEKTTFK
ncbi:MAG: polyamine ABC transporter substrate-binding protein [Proteobacteria bacterium]|nr:polyamine ABC transporter substrate-binding protein [Pseudomonadota bacterium]MBS0547265.1 polyamine ABC transporter substrate-binding protein [Pseudomonadota bacterium]